MSEGIVEGIVGFRHGVPPPSTKLGILSWSGQDPEKLSIFAGTSGVGLRSMEFRDSNIENWVPENRKNSWFSDVMLTNMGGSINGDTPTWMVYEGKFHQNG